MKFDANIRRNLTDVLVVQLPWLIPNWLITIRKVHPWLGYCQFVYVPRMKALLENHSTNTYLWVPKAHA